MNFEIFLSGIWLPIINFNPFVCFLGLVASISTAMMGGGSAILVLTRSLSLVFGSIFGGLMFGFSFSSETSLLTMLLTGITISGGTFFSGILFIQTIRKLIFTQKIVKEQKTKIDNELEEAAAYVKTMLPLPIHNGFIRIDWQFIPSASLGGDAFGYNWLDDDNFAIYLLDVSGHGVGAALLSVSVLNVLRSQSLANTDFKSPNQVLEKLNMAFQGEKHNGMFLTFWYGVYNTLNRNLTYASAGHPPALLFTNGNDVIHLKTRNFVIGGMPDVSYKQGKQRIDTGASLYIFSDGVYEIEKEDGTMWSFSEYVSFLSSLNSNEHNSLDNLYDKTLQISKEKVFEDDYTMIRASFI